MGKDEYFCSKIKEERLLSPWRGKGRQLIEGSLPSPCPSTRNVEKIAVPKEEGKECQKDEKKGHRSVPPPFQVHFKSVPYGCKLLGNQKGTTALKQNDFKLMIYSLMFTLQTRQEWPTSNLVQWYNSTTFFRDTPLYELTIENWQLRSEKWKILCGSAALRLKMGTDLYEIDTEAQSFFMTTKCMVETDVIRLFCVFRVQINTLRLRAQFESELFAKLTKLCKC